MSAHAPGPWAVEGGSVIDGRGFSVGRPDRDEPRICPVERDANASLIAAAPELLAACKLAWALQDDEGLYGWGECMSALHDAIAKAEGKS